MDAFRDNIWFWVWRFLVDLGTVFGIITCLVLVIFSKQIWAWAVSRLRKVRR